ncbi:lysozyme inhibitor LprI family protein [Saccharococcus sp. Marseille-Q5394]|uniref:lysozyme inhibitor LprI family protein n=1 Tax=Saccharococcus sp. Marseille-Q5394 TaxID=2972778 RepID=UPI0021C7EBF9|nr:lysozyme inhibitor LprI family protein [Saccharococcus sp. Marseille-Q5394]
MKSYQKSLVGLLLVAILAACGNTSEESQNAHTSTTDPSQNISNSNDNESLTETEKDIATTPKSMKEVYQQKLANRSKEVDKIRKTYSNDSSTLALKKVEGERYDLWDELLNEVYGVLKEQLSKEEMNQLRDEQRNWITYRDDTAKEASLKYQGGTQEHLEYVVVLADLTEERCYELVEDFME